MKILQKDRRLKACPRGRLPFVISSRSTAPPSANARASQPPPHFQRALRHRGRLHRPELDSSAGLERCRNGAVTSGPSGCPTSAAQSGQAQGGCGQRVRVNDSVLHPDHHGTMHQGDQRWWLNDKDGEGACALTSSPQPDIFDGCCACHKINSHLVPTYSVQPIQPLKACRATTAAIPPCSPLAGQQHVQVLQQQGGSTVHAGGCPLHKVHRQAHTLPEQCERHSEGRVIHLSCAGCARAELANIRQADVLILYNRQASIMLHHWANCQATRAAYRHSVCILNLLHAEPQYLLPVVPFEVRRCCIGKTVHLHISLCRA
jgi:hypothetical protein